MCIRDSPQRVKRNADARVGDVLVLGKPLGVGVMSAALKKGLLGTRADPQASRSPPVRDDADALYNSSLVAHPRRWQLPLPDADRTRAELAQVLARTLDLLPTEDQTQALYFHRLALLHEDMHLSLIHI